MSPYVLSESIRSPDCARHAFFVNESLCFMKINLQPIEHGLVLFFK
jgi:hypothetical protein